MYEGCPKSSITLTVLPHLKHVRAYNTYDHQVLYLRSLGANFHTATRICQNAAEV